MNYLLLFLNKSSGVDPRKSRYVKQLTSLNQIRQSITCQISIPKNHYLEVAREGLRSGISQTCNKFFIINRRFKI
ncbi:hypothetical protein O181_061204 [Austropuccinia psidii MF-1]|uniref:Uncharacterized protein n=1 Tax=Austropuccinia psidii MF-1 TaxID=1389203 RepID=A0A9Q3EHP7_9BASI|nr:hypothetical protein [Austropuccinia psidii MF-1]